METGLAVQQDSALMNFEEYAMSVESVVRQIALIQEVQRKVMKQGEHFGVIPGCGDKPTLLKPGAEKLGFTFRLRPEFDVNTVDWSNGHREYQVKCRLYHIPTGTAVGEGVGTCTTMEGKFRYRWDNTGKPVPKEYWDSKNTDLLGGPFNAPRKVNGSWFIFQKVEHDNPADYYNTCEKMAKKRAHVDAILTATAASDIFTQDIEDMTEVIPQENQTTKAPEQKKEPMKEPQAKVKDPDAPASEPQQKAVHAMYKKTGFEDNKLFDYVQEIIGRRVESTKELTKGEASQVIDKLNTYLNEQG